MSDICRGCACPVEHCTCDQWDESAENGELCEQCGCDLLHEETGICYVCAIELEHARPVGSRLMTAVLSTPRSVQCGWCRVVFPDPGEWFSHRCTARRCRSGDHAIGPDDALCEACVEDYLTNGEMKAGGEW